MKKIVLPLIVLILSGNLFAQKDSTGKMLNFGNRPGDHLMIQFSSDSWTTMPDSVSRHQSGFSRGFNAYVMTDKPFNSNPKISIGLGIGIGSSNISFNKVDVDIRSLAPKLPFTALDSTNHFKKYKVSTSYLEAPVEFRFTSKPSNPNRSWKFAIGGKVGLLINSHTKGTDLEDKNNSVINTYTQKESSKKFFNSTRLMATARAGYGVISVFASYSLNNVLKDIAGPPMKLLQIGFTLSGL